MTKVSTDEQVNKNMEWLNTLSDQQIMALAAQHGVLEWSGKTIKQLRKTLAKLDAINQVREDMRGVSGVCCGEDDGGTSQA